LDLGALLGRSDLGLRLELGLIISMAAVVVGAAVALRLLQVVVHGVANGVLQREKEPSRELAQKAKTIAQVVETTGRIVILGVAFLSILSLLGRDITPLLASAGIAGIAVGFGAQNLIKDWLAGFFILLENQYSVDDVIKVGEHSGLVEKLDLRRTVLRSLDGSVIVIPNGEVRTVTNLTKEWSRVVMDVAVPYEADADMVMELLRRVGDDLMADEKVGPLVLEPPEVLGIESLGQYAVTIRMLVKTMPLQQWAVARALRAAIKRAFDREGIQFPYPHQVNILRHDSPAPEALATLYRHPERSE